MCLGSAETGHHGVFLVNHEQLAAIDNTDAVGHHLGLFDVMRGQDDGDAARAHLIYDRPHALAQFHVDAGGGFVEEEEVGFVRESLGDEHSALHSARQGHDPLAALFPEAEAAQDLFDPLPVGCETEQAA